MSQKFDVLAVAIGTAFRRGNDSHRDGIIAHAEAGVMLAKKKGELAHGEWKVWLKVNRDALGFDSIRTAQRLMEIARIPKATLASPIHAKNLTKMLWGHNRHPRTKITSENDPDVPYHFECYTKPRYIAMVCRLFGGPINLDVMSCQEANDKWVKAENFYTKEQDALLPQNPWTGRIYGNGPFQSRIMTPAVQKLIEQRSIGNITEAVWCSGAFTDAGWFHNLIANVDGMCLVKGRVGFIEPGKDKDYKGGGGPNFGIAFSYLGRKRKLFANLFGEIGTIVKAV